MLLTPHIAPSTRLTWVIHACCATQEIWQAVYLFARTGRFQQLVFCKITNFHTKNQADDRRYSSIRVDSLHYCPRESELRLKRSKKNRSFIRGHRYNEDDDFVHNPVDEATHQRLHLLTETLRSNSSLATLVNYLKLAYTVRESGSADIARAISACPKIMYADLPAGFFSGDSKHELLRREVSANCRDLRFMKFVEGSDRKAERFFRKMGDRIPWPNLEYLSLDGLKVDAISFRHIIGTLPQLKTLALTNMHEITDDAFSSAPNVPAFPSLQILELHNQPMVTSEGVLKYLADGHSKSTLTNLTLDNTNVSISSLHTILAAASSLESLTVIAKVDAALPIHPLPPLESSLLETLHLDLSDADDTSGAPHPTDSCYAYLLNSIRSGTLPSLRSLYVRDPEFPTALATPPNSKRNTQYSLLSEKLGAVEHHDHPLLMLPNDAQQMEVFTKAPMENQWIFSSNPSSRRSSWGMNQSSRSSSHMGHAHLEFDSHVRESAHNLEWKANARRSVLFGTPTGGFVSVMG
jgi:hypothetical protein